MTISISELRALADAAGLAYAPDPDHDGIMASFPGPNGIHHVVILVQQDGSFLQMRTLGFGSCPDNDPNVGVVRRALLHLNYRHRLTKFSIDPDDGEMVAWADMWVADSAVTKAQFVAMLSNFVQVVDLGYGRVTTVLRTGRDPGAGGGAPASI